MQQQRLSRERILSASPCLLPLTIIPKSFVFLFQQEKGISIYNTGYGLFYFNLIPNRKAIISFSGTDQRYLYCTSLNIIRFSMRFGTVQLHSSGVVLHI